MTTRNSVKLCVTLLRYTPVIIAAFMLAYIILDTLGDDVVTIPQLLGVRLIPAILLVAVCHSYHFCKMHMMFTCYDCLATYICHDEEFYLFGCAPVRAALVLIGILLFAWLFTHLARFNRGQKNTESETSYPCLR